MIIMSHRGYWKTVEEKNTVEAFKRSFELGFGTETDVRDHNGQLVISHDMPTGGEMLFSNFLKLVNDPTLPLAINIKADGLAVKVHEEMVASGHKNWFVFDMSVPDTIWQFKAGNPVFTRYSEYEPAPAFYDKADGLWLDAFVNDENRLNQIEKYLADGKLLCIVSPELHKREHLPFWAEMKKAFLNISTRNIMLCTDLPEDAVAFFEA